MRSTLPHAATTLACALTLLSSCEPTTVPSGLAPADLPGLTRGGSPAGSPDSHTPSAAAATEHRQARLRSVIDEVRSGRLAAVARAPRELSSLGAAVVPELAASLGDRDVHVRIVSAWALLELGTAAAPAAAAIAMATADPSEKVRALALLAQKAANGDPFDVAQSRRAHEEAERALATGR